MWININISIFIYSYIWVTEEPSYPRSWCFRFPALRRTIWKWSRKEARWVHPWSKWGQVISSELEGQAGTRRGKTPQSPTMCPEWRWRRREPKLEMTVATSRCCPAYFSVAVQLGYQEWWKRSRWAAQKSWRSKRWASSRFRTRLGLGSADQQAIRRWARKDRCPEFPKSALCRTRSHAFRIKRSKWHQAA